MSGVLGGLATHFGGFFLFLDGWQLFANGERILGSISMSVAILLIVGFYVWGLFHLNEPNSIF
jgi:hypothetical protein